MSRSKATMLALNPAGSEKVPIWEMLGMSD